MSEDDQHSIDKTLAHLQSLHKNIGSMWDGNTIAAFYYNVLSGTVARNGPAVAEPIMAMLTEVYENTARSRTNLGKLTNGFPSSPAGPADASAATE